MWKRLCSLFLALALVLALMPASAQAAGSAAIWSDDLTAAPNDWICIPIRCTGLENLAALELEIFYDPQILQFQSETMGWMLEGALYHVNGDTNGRISLTAATAQGVSGDGVLVYLYFSVASDCPAGSYPLTLAVGDAYDCNLRPVTIDADGGRITVLESAPAYGSFHLGMALSADTLSTGESLTATIQNNWGYSFAALSLTFRYDCTMFELVSAEVSRNLTENGAVYALHTETDGLVRLSCASTRNIWCWDLMTIELRARSEASGSSQLTAEAAEIYDENRIPYQPGSAQAQVTIQSAQAAPIPALRLESEQLVIGTEAESTLILDAGSDLAAADFRLEYDPAVVECVALESAVEDAYLVINPNFSEGVIRFSYVKERGTQDQTPLVTIRWRPKATAARHFTLEASLIDPVNREHERVEIACPPQRECIYRRETAEATCTQPGGTILVCVECGTELPLEIIPALGHSYAEPVFRWAENYETCTAERICARDGSHIWQVTCSISRKTEGESCTTPGSITYTATADFNGTVWTDSVTVHTDSLGHDYAWTVVTEPDCVTEGSRHGACIRCDAVIDEILPPLGHSYETTIKEPTCTEGGFTTHTCSRCGEGHVDSHTDPLGHDWNGLECRRCGETRKNPFTDVPEGSFYYDPVIWAVENGITNGTTATTFGPNDHCMRAHVVTFLWRAAGSPEPVQQVNPFSDVKKSDFYYKAVLWAVENNITNGMSPTTFGPFVYCNRAQVVTFLYRTQENPETSASNPFTDVQKGSFYEKPVLWAVENGITNGLTTTTFGPNATCNRAQIVTFLYRAYT